MSFPELTSKPIEHVNDNEEPQISIISFQSISDGRETFKEDRPAPLFKFPFNRRTPHRLIDGRIYYTIISFRDTFTCYLPKLNDLVGQSSPKSVVNDSGRNIVAKRVPPLTGLPECELPKSILRLYLSGYALKARDLRVCEDARTTHFIRSNTGPPKLSLPKSLSPHSEVHSPSFCRCEDTIYSSGSSRRLNTFRCSPDIFVDASGYGLGVTLRCNWLAWVFNYDNSVKNSLPRDPRGNVDIAWAELIAVELGLRAAVAAGYICARIPIFSDNKGVVIAMKTRTWDGKKRLARVMNRINAFCEFHHLDPQVRWISTHKNPADRPSRGFCGEIQDMMWPPPPLPKRLAPLLYQIADISMISSLDPPLQKAIISESLGAKNLSDDDDSG